MLKSAGRMRFGAMPLLLLTAGLAFAPRAAAQEQGDGGGNSASAAADESAAPAVEEKPADAVELEAKVIEVSGGVEYATLDADPNDPAAWNELKEGDQLGQNTQIRTGLRSRCVLMFGEEPDQTVISLRRATLASLTDFYRTQDEQRVRMGLGYGAVRGGSTEGTLRSDVVVDSTVATLAKRGTEGWEFSVEPVGESFRISLARSGLVTAYSKSRDIARTVRVGEYRTDENIARLWINQDIFDRAIRFYEVASMTDADFAFFANNGTGLGSIYPGGGDELPIFGGRDGIPANLFDDALLNADDLRNRIETLLIQALPGQRPEGNFGFGQTFRVQAPREEMQRLTVNPHFNQRLTSTVQRLVRNRVLLRRGS